MKICKNSTKLKYRDRQNVAAFSVLSCRRRCVSLFLSRKQEKFDLETLINITTDVAAELIPKPFGFHMKLLNCIKKYKTQLSDPEELSSNVNVNAGNEPISRKKKLHDGVDTEDSSAVAISSAAMPKQLKVLQFYANLIPKLFPTENSHTYFIPPQTDGIQQKRAKRKFIERYRNLDNN
ncbi:hypothetical protein Avbf_15691 [Armadillidium vulgare]|nr:hypothetical protein Avbf_15691 [Armadillidium vulgare]